MKQVLINGNWEIIPASANIEEWLNEIISVELDMELLIPQRYIHRFERVQAVRESPKHKAKSIRIVRS